MTSQINPNNVDGTYPVAGQANNTQGFRDNFTNIKTNFQYAEDEITDLQSKAILKSALSGGTLDNNMSDNLIYAVKLQDVSWTYVQNTATSGSINLDFSAGAYQSVSTTGSVSLSFSNWPVTGSAGSLFFTFNCTNTAYTLTLPAAVSQGLYGIQGISPGTPGVSNTITFSSTGAYTFRFDTNDGGTTIAIFDFSRAYNQFAGNVYINGTATSTSTTTGALQVDGGTGIVGNLNVGGDFVTYNGSNNPVFSAYAANGFVRINSPTVPANAAGALNIVGSSDGSYQPITQAGGLIHLTGNDGVSSRFTSDAFGTSAVPTFVGRRSRGTAASPTVPVNNDVLLRFVSGGWNGAGYGPTAGTTLPTGVDFVAKETFSGTAMGSEIQFYNAPLTSNVRTLSATISSTQATFPGIVSATGNVVAGNVNTGAISLSGNVISNLNVTGNITGGNVTTTGLMSTTGNINGGNIIGSALMSCVGNILTTGNVLLNSNGAVGYNAGAGGSVAQTGNKSTGVTLNKPSGQITMQSNNLAADTTVSFTLTNSIIQDYDLLLINVVGGVATPASYNIDANCTSGSAVISVRNITGGTLGEAIVLRYAVIRGSVA